MAQRSRARPARAVDKKEDGLKLFNSAKSAGKELHFLVNQDHTKGYVRVARTDSSSAVTAEEITGFVRGLNVTPGEAGVEAIAAAARQASETKGSVGPFLVATGRPAVNGGDGAIEWLTQRPDAVREVRAADRVDYRERKAIVNVRQGQKILRVTAPTPGQAGEDVFGKVIPCQQGRSVTVRRGKNVEATADGTEFFSQVAGMIEFNGEAVSVDPTLVIQGDLDMTVGNIHFIGPVKVAKDVRDGFYIKAGREIEIGGMVECAELESASFIRIQGGVAGKGKGRIICQGNLEARYLSEVYAECGGDITVTNSITNAAIRSLGKVTVNSGGIRGSSVVAQKGLRTPEIGCEMGIRTTVVVGVDYHLKDELVNIERELGAVREAVEKIERALGPLLANGEIISALPPEKAEIARRLMAQMDVLVRHGSSIAAKRDAILAKMQVGSDFFIDVAKLIYPGVIMQIGTCRRTFELGMAGPMKLYPDVENGSIRVSR